jgi:tetratricopeptide (TPR) repeat protein
VRLAPDEQRYFDRLNTLGGVLEESAEGGNLLDDPAVAAVPSFDSFSFGETVAETPSPSEVETTEFEWNSVAEDAPRGAISFADLNETEAVTDSEPLIPPGGEMLADKHAGGPGSVGGLRQTAAEGLDDQKAGNQPGGAAMMKQELESVDFYITQGYSDIALDTLELLERQFGSHPDIDARRKKLEAGKEDAQATSFEFAVPAVSDSESGASIDAALDLSFGEVVIEPISSVIAPAPPVSSGIDSGLAEIFEEFRVEAEGESASAHEDYETHYNMATAYKEMDLLDEAIREFQVAAGLTGSADGTPRYFHCCNMLGHCFFEKGMPQAAVTWFQKGLNAPGRSAEESKALQYELGNAYEEMGDLTSAVAAFTDVYGVDVGYRDIGDRLASLQKRAAHPKKKGK